MSEHITHTASVKRLERSSSDRILAGVCGGLGRYFDMSPTVFRLGLVVLALLGGAGILVYLAAVLVMPAEDKDRSFAEEVLSQRRDHPTRVVALGLIAVAVAVLLARASTWPSAGAAWVIILVAGLVILWTSKERRAHRWAIAVTSFLAVLLAATVVAVVSAFAWFDVSLGDGVGDHVYAPATAADVRSSYELGIGSLKLDLSQVPTDRELHVRAHVGMGELRVIVPRDASVVVESHVKAGDIDAFGRHDDGQNARVVAGGGDKLFLDTKVGAGSIDVVRAG